MTLETKRRDEWEKGYEAGFRCGAVLAGRSGPPIPTQSSPKVVDLSKVAGSDIPMEFTDSPSLGWNRSGFLYRINTTANIPPYSDRSTSWVYCRFSTTRPSVLLVGNECPLPEGVECRVWDQLHKKWYPEPHSAIKWCWAPGIIYQVTGLLPDWVYPWEVGDE